MATCAGLWGLARSVRAEKGVEWLQCVDVGLKMPVEDAAVATQKEVAQAHAVAAEEEVVLCDDGGRPERKARLAQMAEASRTIYVSRPKLPNVPRHGKAGNLNYALRTVLYPHGAPPSPLVVRRTSAGLLQPGTTGDRTFQYCFWKTS